jgi:choline dehydrogenase-like flavoprotein
LGVDRLTHRQRRALESICQTFCPDGPSPRALGIADTLLELTPPTDRSALLALLSVWDVGRRFSRRPRERREAILRAWRDSPIASRRRVFHGLRRGSLIPYYARKEPPDRPSPIGERRLRPLRVTEDARFDCDVCIVGSGAGGGVAAAVLAQSGLDVVVLEAGPHLEDADFHLTELEAYRRLYLDSAASTTTDGGVGLLAGSCVGGTTTINYTTSFRTPAEVRGEWGDPFTSTEYDASLDAVSERLGVNSDEGKPSRRDEVMARGLERLGWHVAEMPRNVRGCEQGTICGRCGFGCPLGAKQSTLVTWLVDAQQAGARLVPETRARRVLVTRGAASGLEATSNGNTVMVRARVIVLAAGALHTPVLLRSSGLSNSNIGRHLHLHPTTGVSGVFDEEILPWEGTMQALYSDQHRDLDGAGFGLKYETAAVHPGVLVAFAPWENAREHAKLMAQLPWVTGIGLLLRDRSEGEVRVSRSGGPRVRYTLGADDLRHVRVGLDGAAQILEAAGARRIFSSHARLCSYEPGPGARQRFLAEAERIGYGAGRCGFYAFHLMGSARLGPTPATSATKPDGETWETRDLYVMDGSSFPSASGVNPMLTIEAIAYTNARRLAAKLA